MKNRMMKKSYQNLNQRNQKIQKKPKEKKKR